MAGDLLAADQHPFAGQDARLAHDHVFQLLFADERAAGQQRGLGADLPDGMLNGHGLRLSLGLGRPAHGQIANAPAADRLVRYGRTSGHVS